MHSEDGKMKYQLGLIGADISYSFSPNFFKNKFREENISHVEYSLFPLSQISDFTRLVERENPVGLNVTIPYKRSVLKYVDTMDAVVRELGAANTLVQTGNGFRAYNTDVVGIEESLKDMNVWNTEKIALLCGTGGAGRAVEYILRKHEKKYLCLSRKPDRENEIPYDRAEEFITDADLIINATPLGSQNYKNKKPKIPYGLIKDGTVAFDLNYNPKRSLFLITCVENGCRVLNGEKMLYAQAEASWKIWVERYPELISE